MAHSHTRDIGDGVMSSGFEDADFETELSGPRSRPGIGALAVGSGARSSAVRQDNDREQEDDRQGRYEFAINHIVVILAKWVVQDLQ